MKKINRKDFDLLQDEYMINQAQVKTIIGRYINQRNFAIGFAVISLIIASVLMFYSLQIAKQTKVVDKIVFKEDGSGGLTMIGAVNDHLQVKSKVYIGNQLSEYLVGMYSIPTDLNQKKYNVAKVKMMTSADYFSNTLQTKLHDMYKTSGNQVVEVYPNTISEIYKNVWQITWTKLVNNTKVGDFQTNITFVQTDIGDSTELIKLNPLGILVTNVSTQERQEREKE